MTAALATEAEHILYRFFDSDGRLLYVGITNNTARRWADHSRDKQWWPLVAEKTVERFPSREALASAELEAIRAEGPIFNVAGRRVDEAAQYRRLAEECIDRGVRTARRAEAGRRAAETRRRLAREAEIREHREALAAARAQLEADRVRHEELAAAAKAREEEWRLERIGWERAAEMRDYALGLPCRTAYFVDARTFVAGIGCVEIVATQSLSDHFAAPESPEPPIAPEATTDLLGTIAHETKGLARALWRTFTPRA